MSSSVRIIPLGGLGEIGMNCMVIEHDEEIIVVDCGLLFSDLDHFGVEFVIPDFTYLRDRRDKVAGIILTHGHEDHIGALPFALKAGIRAPVFCSSFTSLLVRERLKEYGLLDSVDLRVFKMGDHIEFKRFKVETVSVNHSIIDAAALIIDSPAGTIVHTGDFKIDPAPFYGSTIQDTAFKRAGDRGVALLMSDSTNVERHQHTLGENVVYQKFEQLFAAAEGLTVIAMFASNVSRMGQVMELAKKMGKKVAVSGRSMEQNARLAIERGHLHDAQSVWIPLDEIGDYARKDVIVLSSGSQAEMGSALIRAAKGEHRQIQLQKGDIVLLSSRYIPGNEKAIGRMVNDLFRQGAEVLYEAVHDIHVSGHASAPELKTMLEWVRPKFFVPIHGEYRHLVHHAALARKTGVEELNSVVASNGDVIELTPESCRIVERIEEPRVLVEGRQGNDVSKLVLKDRRQLGEKGVVFSLIVRNLETQRVIAGPEIIAKGLTHESNEAFLIEEAKKVVQKIIRLHEKQCADRGPEFDLQEEIRIELRRFFNANIGKKPVVLPMILDL